MDLNSIEIVDIDGNSKSKLKIGPPTNSNASKIRIIRARPSRAESSSSEVSDLQQMQSLHQSRNRSQSQMDGHSHGHVENRSLNVNRNEALVVTTEVTTVTTTPVSNENGIIIDSSDNNTEADEIEIDNDIQQQNPNENQNLSASELTEMDVPVSVSVPVSMSLGNSSMNLASCVDGQNEGSPTLTTTPTTRTNVVIRKFGDIELSLVDVVGSDGNDNNKKRQIVQSSGLGRGVNANGRQISYQIASGSQVKKLDNSTIKVLTASASATRPRPTTVVVNQGVIGIERNQNHDEPTQIISDMGTAVGSSTRTVIVPDPIVNKKTPRNANQNLNSNPQSTDIDGDIDANEELNENDEVLEDSESSVWNQNNCIVCNVVLDSSSNSTANNQNEKEGNAKLKKFFFEYLGVSETMDFGTDSSFPFCYSCGDDLDKLMALACKIEFMDLQFEKLRDTLARKTVKTYLVRTSPEMLDDDAEQVVDMSDEPLEGFTPKPLINPADVLFNQWKRQYDMIIPGRYKKFPTLMKTVDPKQRVSYYRIDAAGKHHFITTINPDMSSNDQPTTPLVTATATTTNKSPQRGIKRRSYSSVVKINAGDMPTIKRIKQAVPEDSRSEDAEELEEGELVLGEGVGITMGSNIGIGSSDNGHGHSDMDHLVAVDASDEPSDDKIFKCLHCPKSFSSRSILNYHSRVHSGERPFKCNVCDKSFAQRGGLATHALVHSGEKPYSCEECGKSFRQKYHLTQHQLIHSGLKPFSCEICHKSFNVKMNLREHMRRHTGERPYRCTYCTCQGFFRKKMLRDHIVKSHPDNPLPAELQVLGPTPKFPKQKSTNKTIQDMQQMFQDEDIASSQATRTTVTTTATQNQIQIQTRIQNQNQQRSIQINQNVNRDPNQDQDHIVQQDHHDHEGDTSHESHPEHSVSGEHEHQEIYIKTETEIGDSGQELMQEDEDEVEEHQDHDHDHHHTHLLGLPSSTTLISINVHEQEDGSHQLGDTILQENVPETMEVETDSGPQPDNSQVSDINEVNNDNDDDSQTISLVTIQSGDSQDQGPPEPILATRKSSEVEEQEQEVETATVTEVVEVQLTSETETETEAVTEIEVEAQAESESESDVVNVNINPDSDSTAILLEDNITVTTVTVGDTLELEDGVVSVSGSSA